MAFFTKNKADKAKAEQKVDKKALLTSFDMALENWTNATSTEQLLIETGKTRQELLDAVLADDEVEACREDLRTAILAKAWRIWGEGVDEGVINRLYKVVRKQAHIFAELAILAKFNGYSVAEYVFRQEEDGFLVIDKVLNKDGELDYYQPKRDGRLLFTYGASAVAVNQQVKYLLLTSKAVPARPMGELMIIRAYPAVALRKREWAYAGQFIARYAQPYVVAKQGSNGFGQSIKDFTATIFGFINGGATGIGSDDEINLHQLQGDGEAFETIERLCNRRIQKLLLGRVKVSELTAGSRSAQETDDQTRQDRVSAYLDLMTSAIQHAIDAMLTVNRYFGLPIHAPNGLWFEYLETKKFNETEAKIDAIYAATGQVRLTKQRLLNVGYEASEVEIIEADAPAGAYLGDKGLDGIQLSDEAKKVSNKKTQDKDAIALMLEELSQSRDYHDFSQRLDRLDLPADQLGALAKDLATAFVDGLADQNGDRYHD